MIQNSLIYRGYESSVLRDKEKPRLQVGFTLIMIEESIHVASKADARARTGGIGDRFV